MKFLWNLFIPLGISFFFFQFANGRHTLPTKSPIEIESDIRMNEVYSTFNCSVPKPRLAYVHDEIPHKIESNSIWEPPAAIVHRCEAASGCCLRGFRCSPTGMEEVDVVFMKMDMVLRLTTYETLRFINHTSCICREVPLLSSSESSRVRD